MATHTDKIIVEDSDNPLLQFKGDKNFGIRCSGGGFVSVPHKSYFSTAPFTISFWIKTTESASGYKNMLSLQTSDDANGWRIEEPYRPYIVINQYPFARLNNPVNDGLPHHVVFTISGGSPNVINSYRDGVFETTFSGAYTLNDVNHVLEIGGSTIMNRFFNGTLDEVEIWDRVLTQDEITWLYNNGKGRNGNTSDPSDPAYSGLKGGWHFDEGTGVTAYDYSGNSNNGSLSGITYNLGLIASTINITKGTGSDEGPKLPSGLGASGWGFYGMVKVEVDFNDGNGPVVRWIPDYSYATCPSDCGCNGYCGGQCSCNGYNPCPSDCGCNGYCGGNCGCNGYNPCDCGCNGYCGGDCGCNGYCGCDPECSCDSECSCDGYCGCDPEYHPCGCRCDNDCNCDNDPQASCNCDSDWACGENMDCCDSDCCDSDCGCYGDYGCGCDSECHCDTNCGCDGCDNDVCDCSCNGDYGCGCDYECYCNIDCGCDNDCYCDWVCNCDYYCNCDLDQGQCYCDGDYICCDTDCPCNSDYFDCNCDSDYECCDGDCGCNGDEGCGGDCSCNSNEYCACNRDCYTS